MTLGTTTSGNFGAVGVQYFANAVAIGPEVTTAPFSMPWNTATVGNDPQVLTAVARDAAGNRTTAWPVTAHVANSPGRRIEDTDPAVAWSGGWAPDGSRSWSAGSAMATRTAGAQSSVSFTGTTVNWIGGRGPWSGIARVYIVPGQHTVRIEVTGGRNPLSVWYWVVIDAFDVIP